MSKHTLYPFFTPRDNWKKKVYVSGPMTGLPEHNGPAFQKAATTLRELDYSVCNPQETDIILGPLLHEEYLRFDFERVLEADFVVALNGWEGSLGATSEILVAMRIGIPVWGWENWKDYDRISYDRVVKAMSSIASHKASQSMGDGQ